MKAMIEKLECDTCGMDFPHSQVVIGAFSASLGRECVMCDDCWKIEQYLNQEN